MYKINNKEIPQQVNEFTADQFLFFSKMTEDKKFIFFNWLTWANKMGAEIPTETPIKEATELIRRYYEGVENMELIHEITFEGVEYRRLNLNIERLKQFYKLNAHLAKKRNWDAVIITAVLIANGNEQIKLIPIIKRMPADFVMTCFLHFGEEIKKGFQ